MTPQTESAARLQARIEDYLADSARGILSVSRFLAPGEKKQAERSLAAAGASHSAVFWGGYPAAERQCLYLLPDYYTDLPDMIPQAGEEPTDLLESAGDLAVVALRITGSGYRTLTHRDYLGSLLGLGLERDAIGDIALQNDGEAVVFCPRRLSEFLCSDLQKVASDTVKCRPYILGEDFTDGRHYKPISDTVASPRLDCVVAALANLSRADAQAAIRAGLVELDFEPEDRTDHILTPPATISIRGTGRFILRSFDGETRKGRLRLRADLLV